MPDKPQQKRRTNRVFKSLHKPLTYLGVERTLFYFVCVGAVRSGKSKQPYCFEVGDGEVFAFAGLWDRWTDPRGEVVESCAILTTTPNALLADIHNRMPAILRPDDYDLWLNPTAQNTESALRLLSLYTGPMRRYPVSTRINQVENDDADCTKPVELEVPAQGQLFS